MVNAKRRLLGRLGSGLIISEAVSPNAYALYVSHRHKGAWRLTLWQTWIQVGRVEIHTSLLELCPKLGMRTGLKRAIPIRPQPRARIRLVLLFTSTTTFTRLEWPQPRLLPPFSKKRLCGRGCVCSNGHSRRTWTSARRNRKFRLYQIQSWRRTT